MNCKLRQASLLRILVKKIESITCARRPRATFFKLSVHLSVRKSREKLKTNVWKIESKPLETKHRYAPKFFKHHPLFCSFSLQVIFFPEQPFYGNYSTLDSHTHTVISLNF